MLTQPKSNEASPPPHLTLARKTLCIRAADGWALNIEVIQEVGPLKGLAVLGHAMMVDRRSMDRPRGAGLASTLAQAGWRVYLIDVRGHGASSPPASCQWPWTYDDIVRFDLPACVEAARNDRPGYPVVLVGHSLCGHCSIAAAGTGAYPHSPRCACSALCQYLDAFLGAWPLSALT